MIDGRARTWGAGLLIGVDITPSEPVDHSERKLLNPEILCDRRDASASDTFRRPYASLRYAVGSGEADPPISTDAMRASSSSPRGDFGWKLPKAVSDSVVNSPGGNTIGMINKRPHERKHTSRFVHNLGHEQLPLRRLFTLDLGHVSQFPDRLLLPPICRHALLCSALFVTVATAYRVMPVARHCVICQSSV